MRAFDTLDYAKKLKDAGLESKIAEAQSKATAEILEVLVEKQLATKSDIKDLEVKLYGFITKSITFAVTLLTLIQLLFHFWK